MEGGRNKVETCGLLLAGGNGTRLLPITQVVNKHLLPVYDKPMIFYSLSTLMLAGIRRIAIITKKEEVNLFKKLLGDGTRIGIQITYLIQKKPIGVPDAYITAEEFIGTNNVVLSLGDNIFVGQGLGVALSNALTHQGAHIFAFPVINPKDYGVVTIEPLTGKIASLVEKPQKSKSKLAVPGLYLTDNNAVEIAKTLKPSKRGELEIMDLLNFYLANDKLSVSVFRRGVGWMDAGSIDSLYTAGELVNLLQKRQGMQFANIEEIAWRNGWINNSDFKKIANSYPQTSYQKYLINLLE